MSARKTEAEAEHRARVRVECPICHWRHLLEMEADLRPEKSLPFAEVRAGLEAWLASRCPDHLSLWLGSSKN